MRWLENAYWQFFTGEAFFQTRLPCDPSSLTRWRQRLDEAGMEGLLAQTIAAAQSMKAVDTRELSRVIVDTTMQEKITKAWAPLACVGMDMSLPTFPPTGLYGMDMPRLT